MVPHTKLKLKKQALLLPLRKLLRKLLRLRLAAPARKAAPAPAPAPKAAAPVAAGATTVSAPMPGKVLSVNVKAGDAVKSGDVLLILEAMKMQNEIMAPADGTGFRRSAFPQVKLLLPATL